MWVRPSVLSTFMTSNTGWARLLVLLLLQVGAE